MINKRWYYKFFKDGIKEKNITKLIELDYRLFFIMDDLIKENLLFFNVGNEIKYNLMGKFDVLYSFFLYSSC